MGRRFSIINKRLVNVCIQADISLKIDNSMNIFLIMLLVYPHLEEHLKIKYINFYSSRKVTMWVFVI